MVFWARFHEDRQYIESTADPAGSFPRDLHLEPLGCDGENARTDGDPANTLLSNFAADAAMGNNVKGILCSRANVLFSTSDEGSRWDMAGASN